MVVAKLDVVGVTRLEPEADAPLVVDRDGELPTTVAAERVLLGRAPLRIIEDGQGGRFVQFPHSLDDRAEPPERVG